MSRLIAISQINGDYTSLRNLMDELKITKNDELVFLGNYIGDAGQDAETIDYLVRIRAYRKAWFILGYNDSKFLDFILGGDAIDVDGAIQSYKNHGIPWQHEEFFKSLHERIKIPSIDLGDIPPPIEYVFTHYPIEVRKKSNQINIHGQTEHLMAAILPKTRRGEIQYVKGGSCTA